MKPARLRKAAQHDALTEVRYYRREAGVAVAQRLLQAIQASLAQIEHNPGIGSPRLGHALGAAGLRTWRIAGFPLAAWYFERDDHVDVARLVGQRQDALSVDLDETAL